jgi:hypothetical protein
VKPNRSIPRAQVIPVLIYPDVREAVEWLGAAFGFVERVRIGENHRAQLRFGDGALIVGDVRKERGVGRRAGRAGRLAAPKHLAHEAEHLRRSRVDQVAAVDDDQLRVRQNRGERLAGPAQLRP